MRKILLASLLALALAVPAAAQPVILPTTTASIPVTGTVATATVLIAGVTGQTIYVTQVTLVPNANAVVTFTQGTGAACGTGTTNVTGVMTFAVSQHLNAGSGAGALWVLVQGNSLCITIATAVAPGSVSYARF